MLLPNRNCINSIEFYANFLNELANILSQTTDLCLQNRFNETLISVENRYGFEKSNLYNDLYSYLLFEKELCDQLESGNVQPNEINVIYKEIDEIMKHCQKNYYDVEMLGNLYENLKSNLSEKNNVNAQFDELIQGTIDNAVFQEMRNAELIRLQAIHDETTGNIELLKQSIPTSIQQLLQNVGGIESIVIDVHLKSWNIEQLQFLNEKQPISNLDNIQMWFEGLMEILVYTSNQLERMSNLHNISPENNGLINCLPQMKTHCGCLMENLIYNSLVFEKQPERIIKTETRFQPKVRLLIGKSINARMSDIQVDLQLISAENAQEILRNRRIPEELNTGTLENNQRSLVFAEQTSVCAADFK